MRRFLTALCLLLAPTAGSAQEGRIIFSRAVEYDFELPERLERLRDRIPMASVTEMVLLFNPSESLMKPAPIPDPEAEPAGLSDRDLRMKAIVARLKMRSTSRGDLETLVAAYTRLEDGAMAETRDFMGRTFRISGARPAYRWRISGEQREFLGFTVHKATTTRDSSAIEAWFAPEIPVPAGPGPYGGLPGMILVVSVDDGHTVYSAREVDLSGLAGEGIEAPDDGREVSREEYEEIVAEKLEELRTLNRTDRVRRRPPR